MYAHTHSRAIATVALATFAAACGGRRSTDQAATRDVAIREAAGHPAPPVPAPSVTPASDPNVSYATAESAYTARRYSDAVEMFGNYVVRHPQNVWANYMRGVSAWKAGQLDTARAAFEAALALDPYKIVIGTRCSIRFLQKFLTATKHRIF